MDIPDCNAIDHSKEISEPGCKISTVICAGGNKFDGTKCVCGSDRLLNAGACECGGTSIPDARDHYC